MDYKILDLNELKNEFKKIKLKFNIIKDKNLNFDISRGKPSDEQILLSSSLNEIKINNWKIDGFDLRNYGGGIEGIKQARDLMSIFLGCNSENIFVIGNSSLYLMAEVVQFFLTKGIDNEKWISGKDKIIALVPGYDRHFKICEYFDLEMVSIPMTLEGPDIIYLKNKIESDKTIKGVWCVPKFSNPQGYSYSDEVIKEISKLKPASKTFRILWDNAYSIHDFKGKIKILNIFDLIKNTINEEIVISFASTSKVTTAGSGIAAIGCLGRNYNELKKYFETKLITPDKINQMKHVLFFSNYKLDLNKNLMEKNLENHMQKHANILNKKFKLVIEKLESEFLNSDAVKWTNPCGGYFLTLETYASAKEIVECCKIAGLKLTKAGSTHPYNIDPTDSFIRIAPSYLKIDQLNEAMDILVICIKMIYIKKLINQKINHNII